MDDVEDLNLGRQFRGYS